MLDVVWLIPALPLAGFLLLVLFGRRLGEPKAGYLAAAMCGGAFVVTALTFFDMLSKSAEERSHVVDLFSWIPVGSLEVKMAFLADPLSITMALFVTGIGTLIHLYAVGYMHGDPKFSKFFIYLNLFAFSMLMLVLGENLLVTFLGWEGVGTCSYFLISFWHTRNSAAVAGKKAFVTNRIGDFGVMTAMFLAFSAVGSVSYGAINEAAHHGELAPVTATAIAMLLFVGACGKSAQLPLYLWLPDAMEGPTPVSALIHAATMVTAGVFLMTRMAPVLHESYSWAPMIVASIGAATALFAATVAVAQNDIKKVLAYSTVSQLGYMMMGLGAGAWLPAVFHIFTHAFFKACLFLGAGSISHSASHHSFDMKKDMGGLRKHMPITFATW
ncbi:MAG: NADH-quinone oxidoreductase subunit L, partial [Actinomycetota bacterium]